MKLRLAPAAAAIAACACAAPAAARAAVIALPDLVEQPPAQVSTRAVTSTAGTQYQLVFLSGAANIGDGPLQVDGARQSLSDPMIASQQIFDTEGNVVSTKPDVGEMQYVSFNHQHFHYLDFEHYELRRASDDVQVGIDSKQGFCLGDVQAVAANPPPTRYPFGYGAFCQQNNPDALSVSMGVTNCWEDLYAPQKEGQYIDITGLAAGSYYLVHHVNQNQALLEKDYSNDDSSALIDLSWPNGMDSLPAVTVLSTSSSPVVCPGASAATGDATGVGTTSATLNGTLDPRGRSGVSAYFQYGASTNYGAATPSQPVAGGSPVPVSAPVGGLTPDTTYHFRLDGQIGGGTFAGDDRSFTTLPLPPASAALPGGPVLPAQAPKSFFVRALRPLRGGRAKLRLYLPGPGSVSLLARVRGARGRLVEAGSAKQHVRRRGSATFVVRLNDPALALLASRGRLPVSLRITFRPAGGRARSLNVRLTLR